MDPHPSDGITLVTGSSGLVGTALGRARPIVGLQRGAPGDGSPWWDPGPDGAVHVGDLPVRAVVHLAGAGVADHRWTDTWKAAIRDSRVHGSRALVRWLASLPAERRPECLVAASAIGFYGDRGEERLVEDSPAGQGFLAEVCQAWEDEVRAAEDLGIRTVRVRIGIVLSREGGALDKMLLPFKLGGGGPMGSGRQWFPWIHIDDIVGIFERALDDSRVSGAVNAVAPGIVRQGEFAKALGRALHRPAVVPTPAFALKLAMGAELAEEALLASARVEPAALSALGHPFRWPELDPALGDLVG